MYAVRIEYKDNNGTGVIFSIDEQVVILTAAHVLKNEEIISAADMSIKRYLDGRESEIDFDLLMQKCSIQNDLAILLIKTTQKVEKLDLAIPSIEQSIKMYGFPDTLSDSKDTKTITLTGKIAEINNQKVCVQIDNKLGSANSEEIDTLKGFSGSGFFFYKESKFSLCGIETNALDKNVSYNTVCGVSSEAIAEILESVGIGNCFAQTDGLVASVVKKSNLYMSHLLLMEDYSAKTDSKDRLAEEYSEGVDVHPEHIRRNLDIRREKWIKRIDEGLKAYSTVIVRGASGQGKTSLAYRYFEDHYSENQVIFVKQIYEDSAIGAIIQFLKTELRNEKYILYYDVQPGDNRWGKFISAVWDFLVDIPLIVTVREEDYNLCNIRQNIQQYSEIELELSEEEARELYAQYEQHTYLSFDELWKNFGGSGPLLEFIYMLNHSTTLEEKIKTQVAEISDAIDEGAWYSVLAIIAIAGEYDISLRLDRLFDAVKIKNASRLLQQFEKEFFIKVSEKRDKVKCLHAVRAKLILKALQGKFGFCYSESLLLALSIIESNGLYMLLEYINDKGLDEEFVEKLSCIRFQDVEVIEDVLRGLLWYSVFEYQRVNESVINEGNRLLNNSYLMFAVGDTTGFINTNTISSFLQILDKQRPGIADKMNELVKMQPERYLNYTFAKLFLAGVSSYIIALVKKNAVEGRSLGYILFWASKFELTILIDSPIVLNNKNDYMSIAELIKGLIYQEQYDRVTEIKDKYEKEILNSCNIALLKIDNEEVYADVIPSYCKSEHGKESENTEKNNEDCMRAINLLGCLYPKKRRYNVQLLVTRLGDLQLLDTEKHISFERMHERWIAELNGIGIRLQKYKYAAKDWESVYKEIDAYRRVITELLEELLKQWAKLYKKNQFEANHINQLIQVASKKKSFEIPKCALDKFGLDEPSSQKLDEQQTNGEKNNQSKSAEKYKWIEKVYNDYVDGISNFINGLYGVMEGLKINGDSDKYYRIPFYNIVSAYENYRVFNATIDSFFKQYINLSSVDKDNELLVLEKTVAMMYWIYNNGFRKNDNVVYEAYELFKKKKRLINDYLERRMGEYQEVHSISKSENDILIKTALTQSDELNERIYRDIQSLVGCAVKISPERAYLINKVDHIIMTLLDDGNNEMMTVKIPIKNYTNAPDLAKLNRYNVTAERSVVYVPDVYVRKGIIVAVAEIGEQMVQIEDRLLESPEFSVEYSIASANKVFKDSLKELADRVRVFSEYEELYNDIQEISMLNIVTQDASEYRKNKKTFAKFIKKYEDEVA